MLNFLNSGIGFITCIALIVFAVAVKLVGTGICTAYVLDAKRGLATELRHHVLGVLGVGFTLLGYLGIVGGFLGALASFFLLILTYIKNN